VPVRPVVTCDRQRFSIAAAISTSPHVRLGSHVLVWLNDRFPLDTDTLAYTDWGGVYDIPPTVNCAYQWEGELYTLGYPGSNFLRWTATPQTAQSRGFSLQHIDLFLVFDALFTAPKTVFGWVLANSLPGAAVQVMCAQRYDLPLVVVNDTQPIPVDIEVLLLSKHREG